MAAYIIADIAEITDPAAFGAYAGKAGPTKGNNLILIEGG